MYSVIGKRTGFTLLLCYYINTECSLSFSACLVPVDYLLKAAAYFASIELNLASNRLLFDWIINTVIIQQPVHQVK